MAESGPESLDEEDAVELRQCGNSNLKLSALGMGCWSFGGGEYWGETNQKDVNAVVRRSVELGINYFDTAEAYNAGRSEESLGRSVKGLPRDQFGHRHEGVSVELLRQDAAPALRGLAQPPGP